MNEPKQPEESAEAFSKQRVVGLIYCVSDIFYYAEEAGVDEDLALRRVRQWRRPIEETAAKLCDELLRSVVEYGHP